MLNDRDDKHDDHEESEYHFSDEESYEAEPETPKSARTSGPHESLGSRLAKSKRLMITIAVFLVLVFVVYKMVSPSSSSVTLADVNAPIVAAAQNAVSAKPKAPAAEQPAAQPAAMQAPVISVQPIQAAPQQQQPAQAAPVPPPPPTSAAMPTQMPAGTPQPMPTNQAMVSQPVPAQPMMAPPAMPPTAAQPVASAPAVQQPSTVSVISMPSVIPVQPAVPSAVPSSAPPVMATGPNQAPVSSPTVTIVPSGDSVDAKIASLEASNEKMMNQLQTDYSQKVNDYVAQNKALQEQVQTLNSRIAGMETQLNHLVRALTRQNQQQPTSGPSGAMTGKQFPPIGPEIKIAYSVQAIIPGRAWLRSDNGEAITVAEGDTIKDLGRVTKIDPYDGVVEINTGRKLVSLSYGNGVEG